MSSEFAPSPRASKRRKTGASTVVESKQSNGIANGTSVTTDGNERDSDSDSDMIVVSAAANELDATPSRSTVKSTKRQTAALAGDDEPQTPSRSARGQKTTASKKRSASRPETARDLNSQDGNSAPTPQIRSSGRQRKAPRRLEDSLAGLPQPKKARTLQVQDTSRPGTESPSASPAPRSILTPSKNRKTGPRKSVAFNAEDRQIEEQFGFRDIATPAKPTPKATAKRKATPHPKKSKPAVVSSPVHDNDSAASLHSASLDMEGGAIEDGQLDEAVCNVAVPVPKTKRVQRFNEPFVEAPDLHSLRSVVLARLSGQILSSKTPEHLRAQYTQLHTLLEATISAGESNSLLLLGPRGAGKTLLTDLALRDLSSAYNDDFHVVRLSGFLQTDDRIALREIWRQLGHDRNLDEAETEDIGASYADTMASLLSLLSIHNGMAEDGTADVNMTSKSIVFVLDEFDLFTTHPRQTLLYNLFDIAQSKKAPIAVVGCSTRMDVIECLEKRVKSRFSHRWLLVPGCKNMHEWEACVEDALMIDQSDEAKVRRAADEQVWVNEWNNLVKDHVLSSPEVQRLIKMHYYTTKSLPDLFMALFPLVATVQAGQVTTCSSIGTEHDYTEQALIAPSILHTIPQLPALHLALLIASGRLTTIYHLPTPNFNLVHTHYSELIDSTRLKQAAAGSMAASGSLRIWSRDICREAWEELGSWGMLIAVQGSEEGMGRAGVGGEGEEDTRMWRSEVSLEDLEWIVRTKFEIGNAGKGGGGAGDVLLRWCREI